MMFDIILWLGISLLIPSIFFFVGSGKKLKEGEFIFDSASSYECGFDMFSPSIGASFSIQFFNIGLLYLLVDLEIALIMPFFFEWGLHMWNVQHIFSLGVIFFLLIVLLVLEYQLGGFSCWDVISQ